MSTADTIFARASGAGRAGVAVWRVSGPLAFSFAEALAGRALPERRPTLARLAEPGDGAPIDEGLVILFRGPRSFTGEDVAEFHLHGARAVERAFTAAALAAGLRPAEPGEFTRRAFVSGRLDLAEVEALADLIDAETSLQLKQALGQLGGSLSRRAEDWRRALIEALAPLEAAIDFPDEADVPADIAVRAAPRLDALIGALEGEKHGAARAVRLREGVEAILIGAPNAGKSSLMNALAGAEVAIVAPTPGTTRDLIETRLDLAGAPVILSDAAGLVGHTADPIEAEGVARARRRAEAADLRILVIDPYTDESAAAPALALARPGDILVWSKADLAAPGPAGAGKRLPPMSLDGAPDGAPEGLLAFSLSARTGAGMAEFLAGLARRVEELTAGAEPGALTRARHVRAVEAALERLHAARARLADAPELAAEDVRLAARALGRITGAVDVEDVLGEIFSSFCIGK